MPDLTSSPALDLAIGMSFVFLLLSLLASAVQEWLAGVLALRSATLEKGLRNMLETESPQPTGAVFPQVTRGAPARNLVDEFYLHPLIRSLYKETWWPFGHSRAGVGGKSERLPSYISPRAFALALSDTLAPNVGLFGEQQNQTAILRSSIVEMNVPGSVKQRLLVLLDDADGDVTAFTQRLEAWFDDTMARVSGWYKRQTQLILLVIAAIVVIGLNANTITIGNRLWRDSTVRDAVVRQATSPSVTGSTPGATPQERLQNAASNVDSVTQLGVPLGWAANAKDPRHVSFTSINSAIAVLAGWVLTIAAVSLGAPFWFDTLSRLSRLRSSGKPETPLPASGRGQPNERIVTPADR